MELMLRMVSIIQVASFHSKCYDDARKVADLIEERFPKLSESND